MACGSGGGLEGIGACGSACANADRPCMRPAGGGLAWALDIEAAPEGPELEAPGPGLKTTRDCWFGLRTSKGWGVATAACPTRRVLPLAAATPGGGGLVARGRGDEEAEAPSGWLLLPREGGAVWA